MSDNREYKEIGKNIESGVKEALFTGNWDSLNSAITKSVDTVLDGVGDKINEKFYGDSHKNARPLSEREGFQSEGGKTREWEERLREERRQRRREMDAERAQRQARKNARQVKRNTPKGVETTQLAFPYRNVGEVPAVLYTVGGGIGIGVVGVGLLIGGFKAILGVASLGGFISAGVFGIIFGGLLGKGIATAKLKEKAERYVQLIGKRNYIEIKTLALLTNQTPKSVIKDLKKMLKKGYFPEGHIDEMNTTFILTDSVFHQYLETKENAARAYESNIIDSTAREVDPQYPNLSPEEASELKQMIAEGNSYVTRVHELNDIIPGEEISSKLSRLEGLLGEIFARVKEHPEQMSKMHELMDYYLPTAIKIVEAYSEYDDISEPGPEIVKAKSDIENTLETINNALSKLLNNLFKDSVWDVTTDAQVLKTVLAQKGLANDIK